ncbi:MAG: CCA tRNA nucleotidyltransferase [Tranquillimonas sp.]
MTRLDGSWLRDPATLRVMEALIGGGHRALFVGGCVRNELLGAPVSDIDIATDALPDRVAALAAKAGLKPVPTGADHGTVTVIADAKPHEVTTFRRDIRTDGRRADVTFTDDIVEDARRRDFTINALYAEADGTLRDPLGGFADLTARRVRFIEDAERRICEDYLRILRFFRFHAWYGDPAQGLDAEGYAACARLASGMSVLSRERVGAEMKKLLAAPDPAPAIAAMAQAPVLGQVLPGAVDAPLPVLVHLEQVVAAGPDPLRRLAVLGGEDAAPRLRLSRKEAARLALLRDGIGSTAGTAELSYRFGSETARDIELLRAATFGAPLPARLQADLALGAAAEFPVTPADLMPRYQGRALGQRLAELERRWIASGFSLGRDDLLG